MKTQQDQSPPLTVLTEDVINTLRQHDNKLTVREFINLFKDHGFSFIVFLFAFPAAIPLPGIGINVLIAMPLLILSAQQMLGHRALWLPGGIMKRSVPQKRLIQFLESAQPWLRRIQIILCPRLQWFTGDTARRIAGFCGVIMALCVCIPFPMTNTVPSFGIALMALGLMMKDGLAVLAGAIIGITWVALVSYVLIFIGIEGIDLLKDAIHNII